MRIFRNSQRSNASNPEITPAIENPAPPNQPSPPSTPLPSFAHTSSKTQMRNFLRLPANRHHSAEKNQALNHMYRGLADASLAVELNNKLDTCFIAGDLTVPTHDENGQWLDRGMWGFDSSLREQLKRSVQKKVLDDLERGFPFLGPNEQTTVLQNFAQRLPNVLDDGKLNNAVQRRALQVLANCVDKMTNQTDGRARILKETLDSIKTGLSTGIHAPKMRELLGILSVGIPLVIAFPPLAFLIPKMGIRTNPDRKVESTGLTFALSEWAHMVNKADKISDIEMLDVVNANQELRAVLSPPGTVPRESVSEYFKTVDEQIDRIKQKRPDLSTRIDRLRPPIAG